VLLSTAGTAAADSPRLLFDRSQISELRQRISQPKLAPVWTKILADCTEAYNRNSAGKPGAVVQHARRHALFAYPHRGAPAYAVVVDDLCKDDRRSLESVAVNGQSAHLSSKARAARILRNRQRRQGI